MKLCFFVSGGGGNLKFFHLAKEKSILENIDLSVVAVRECAAVDYAKKHDIECRILKYSINDNKDLLKTLDDNDPDYIITTWNKIIDDETVELYRNKMINLHYSLLPAFKGMMGTAPIEEAYKMGCKYTGVTCHFVEEKVDAGKIIAQAVIKADKPIEYAIKETFEKGCLVLLNSIVLMSSEKIIESFEGVSGEFSPSLSFDQGIFNRDFWEMLSRL